MASCVLLVLLAAHVLLAVAAVAIYAGYELPGSSDVYICSTQVTLYIVSAGWGIIFIGAALPYGYIPAGIVLLLLVWLQVFTRKTYGD